MTKTQRAFVLAPLAAPLAYAAVTLLEALADPHRRGYATQNFARGLGVIVGFGAPVAYAAMLVLVAPALWILRRAGALTWWTVVLAGAAAGMIVAAIITPQLRGELFSVPMGLWRGAIVGAASGALWSWIALRAPRLH